MYYDWEDTVIAIFIAVVVGLVATLFVGLIVVVSESEQAYKRFEKKCYAAGGHREERLCIDNDKILFRMEESK